MVLHFWPIRASVTMTDHRDIPPERQACGGFAFIEVVFAAALLALTVVSVGGAFGSNLSAARQARSTNVGARFLEQTMASLDATAFANLTTLNGNVFLDQTNASAARFSVTLTVEQVSIDLLRLTAVLRDRRIGQEMTRLVALRSDR